MKVYHYQAKQFLPITMSEAWDFFSSPRNLANITPPQMAFEILSITRDTPVYAGQIIQYKISVLPFMRIRWVTEITHVKNPDYFIDEQRFGPYSIWHHEHHFKQVDNGIEMIDEVSYALPLGILGGLTHSLFVKKEIEAIFSFRRKTLDSLFKK